MFIYTPKSSNNSTPVDSGYNLPNEFNFSNQEAYALLTNPSIDDSFKAHYRDQFANAFAASQAATANQFEAEQARINREFQQNMSDTQFQRVVADLQKAGLNPALAYSQGGAGNLSGSTANSKSANPTTSSNKSGSATLDLVSNFVGSLLDALFIGLLFKGKK